MGKVKTVLFDIGGVLLTNGWDHKSRELASIKFQFDHEESEKRHKALYYMHEEGNLTLDEYLNLVYFYKERLFSLEEFKQFMFDQSKPFEEMLQFLKEFKKKSGLQIGVLSNEGKDLGEYRIETFNLRECADFFIVSGYVGVRKPSPKIFELATQVAHARPEEICYVDDRELLIEVANSLGFQGVLHKSLAETKQALQDL